MLISVEWDTALAQPNGESADCYPVDGIGLQQPNIFAAFLNRALISEYPSAATKWHGWDFS